MNTIVERITEAIKDILINFIQSGMEDMFVEVNNKVGTIATQVGQTPQSWNGNVFSLIKSLSDTVMVPIAGLIITFVLCYELISMITQKNNFHEFETFNIFIWVFKAYVAIYLVTNTFNITMAVFDVGQHVVNSAAGVISSSAEIDATTAIGNLLDKMQDMEVGELFLLALETMLISMTMKIQKPVNIHRSVGVHDLTQDPLNQHGCLTGTRCCTDQNIAVPQGDDFALFFGPFHSHITLPPVQNSSRLLHRQTVSVSGIHIPGSCGQSRSFPDMHSTCRHFCSPSHTGKHLLFL